MATTSFADLPPTDAASDDKGRITLPAVFMRQLEAFFDDKANIKIYVTISSDGCIEAYPPEQWTQYRSQLENDAKADRRNRALRREVRRIVGSASPVTPDKQNRIKLPGPLCNYAKISKSSTVTFTGHTENLEIWDKQAYQDFLNDDPAPAADAKGEAPGGDA